ncbi:hypothetical protein, partial [Hyphomicrobium sp.]|uniref:hypothetical protein n=1 Tax=Hyphomicrobium sp. TaxID=82 RepID=UPI0025C7129E
DQVRAAVRQEIRTAVMVPTEAGEAAATGAARMLAAPVPQIPPGPKQVIAQLLDRAVVVVVAVHALVALPGQVRFQTVPVVAALGVVAERPQATALMAVRASSSLPTRR